MATMAWLTASGMYAALTGLLILGVLVGIRKMASPRSAALGNAVSAACMAGFILLTLGRAGLLTAVAAWTALAVGAACGLWLGLRASMIRMPELVALFNGLGGAASAVVAVLALSAAPRAEDGVAVLAARLGLAIGVVTLSGSLAAAAKLGRILPQQPLRFPGQNAAGAGLIAVLLVGACWPDAWPWNLAAAYTAVALLFGALVALRVGGADMPITIALLNALSGMAAAFAGIATGQRVLIALGGIVGAGGLMLTRIMCRAMNRRLGDILTGRTTVAGRHTPAAAEGGGAPAAEPDATEQAAAMAPLERAVRILNEARRVVLIPGYGMALAQAQHEVRALFAWLEQAGKDVCFAIHPVAGRMPGHMHVLLAEARAPYDKFREIDDINPEFPDTDVAIAIGANDVMNPAANGTDDTPLSGMPVLDAGAARHLIVCNLDAAPGYAGVPNPLYERPTAVLLWGNARETVKTLTDALAAKPSAPRSSA